MGLPEEKLQKLKENLKKMKSAAIAFSGGVDSSFLLKTAHDALGENVIAYTFVTDFFPSKETEEAAAFCKRYGIRHELIRVDILSDGAITKNPIDRCYLCKKKMFSILKEKAAAADILNVAEGSNADDEKEYRPGMKAVAELGISSPLKDAGLTKTEIRELSKETGLETWDKPSLACLASRFAYGETLTKKKLLSVEKAEEKLKEYAKGQIRVRVHGDTARIETEKEAMKDLALPGNADEICAYLKGLGFRYVTLDLEGYRTGSMDPPVSVAEKTKYNG